MNKEQKTAVVEELTSELKDADAIFAIDYRGISVPQAAELRSGLREADARFRVVKNRLTLLAAEKAGTAEIKDHLEWTHGAHPGPGRRRAGRQDDIADWATSGSCSSSRAGSWTASRSRPTRSPPIAMLPGRDQLERPVRRHRRQPPDRAGSRPRVDGAGPGRASRSRWPTRASSPARHPQRTLWPFRRAPPPPPAEEPPAEEETPEEPPPRRGGDARGGPRAKRRPEPSRASRPRREPEAEAERGARGRGAPADPGAARPARARPSPARPPGREAEDFESVRETSERVPTTTKEDSE